MDTAQLQDACEAVEELQAALAASVAAEETARLETDGLHKALDEYRREEEERFSKSLRQQADLMRMHRRLGELGEANHAAEAAAGSAAIDVRVIQGSLERAEAEVAGLTEELAHERERAAAQLQAVTNAREREGGEHRVRVTALSAQLDALMNSVNTQRVGARQYVEDIEPMYARLKTAIQYELELSSSMGKSWVTMELGEAQQRVARAEARLEEGRHASAEERRAREAQHEARCEDIRASCARQVDELKEHISTLVIEQQEAQASARAAQQRVLEQLESERAAFHTALREMQGSLGGARSEGARRARLVSRLVARVMREWGRKRAVRVLGAWRLVAQRSRHRSILERQVVAETRLTGSAMAIAVRRWQHRELLDGFLALRDHARARAARRARGLARAKEAAAAAAAARERAELEEAAAQRSRSALGSAGVRREQYLAYLEACLSQRRAPAEEVVEMAQALELEHPPLPLEAEVLRRIRSAEIQLGVQAGARPPAEAAAAVAAAFTASAAGGGAALQAGLAAGARREAWVGAVGEGASLAVEGGTTVPRSRHDPRGRRRHHHY
jgi:hypothetical protein